MSYNDQGPKGMGIVGAFLGGCFTLVFVAFMLALFVAFGEWLFGLF